MSKQLLILASVACLPLVSVAQTDPASSHFYIGVGANLLTNVPFNSSGVPRLIGPALTAGVQLTPHLALQAGVAYHWKSDTRSYSYSDPSQQLSPIVNTSTYRAKYFTVPVLLRYTFTPSPERFHVDALAGVTVLHATSHTSYTSTSIMSPYNEEYNSATTRATLTLGPAIRYSVSPQVELTANSLVSAVIGDTYYSFSDRLFLNVLVGAQYSFGSR
jgi:hypothetical protein